MGAEALLRIHVVDPAAYTPPYDHALCGALARTGRVDVTLVTGRFAHGEVPEARGYAVDERFYRGTSGLPARARTAARAALHVPEMLRYRRAAAREADVVHFQWLAVPQVDHRLLPADRPLVLTAHNVLPRGGSARQVAGTKAALRRADAIVVHSEHGRGRLLREVGIDPVRVHVIPHGTLDHFTQVGATRPPELPEDPGRPVVLFFGLIRPYKGIDVLYDAWRRLRPDAELWIVGRPWGEVPPAPEGARTVARFVSDAEAAWAVQHADVVVLPYREIDQSGVLFTAMGFGKALLLSDVGGFPEVAQARHFPAGDAAALATHLDALLTDRAGREALGSAALEAARTTYSWEAIAARHADLYAMLPGR